MTTYDLPVAEFRLGSAEGNLLPVVDFTLASPEIQSGQGTTPVATIVGRSTEISIRSVDMNGRVYAVYPSGSLKTIVETVNQPQVATFNVPINAPDLDQLPLPNENTTPVREVQIWRNGHLMHWGPVTSRRADSKTRTYEYTSKDPLWYLSRRNIGKANRANHLRNGSFESGTSHWVNHGCSAFVSSPAQHAIDGNALGLSATGGDQYAVQFAAVHGTSHIGTVFFVTAWFYLQQMLGTAPFKLGLYAKIAGSTRDDAAASAMIDTGTPLGIWTRLGVHVFCPADLSTTLEVRLYCPYGVIYWDAVTATVEYSLAFDRDQKDIALQVVRYMQGAGEFANSGGVNNGKSDLKIGLQGQPTGIRRIRVYQEADHQPCYQNGNGSGVLDEFTKLPDGFDFRLDTTPTTRTFRTYFPKVGVDHSDLRLSFVRDDDGHIASSYGITGWDFAETIEEPCANDLVILGGWGGNPDREEGGFHDASSLGGLTLERIESAESGTPIDALNGIAATRGQLLKRPISTLSLTLAEPRDPITNEVTVPLIGVLRAGDTVPQALVIDGDVRLDGPQRFVQVTYNAEQENLTVVPNTAS